MGPCSYADFLIQELACMSAHSTAGGSPPPGSSPDPSAAVIFGSFLRLGVTAFGGPAMIAHIKEMSVIRNKWLTGETFKDGVVICQSLPGATAMQMAAYVGLRVRGVRGAIASYTGFGLPAFLLMLVLAVLYSGSREMPLVVSLFRGLQVMVVAIVANATFTFGRDIGKKPSNLVLAAVAAALFWIGVSPFVVIAGAAIVGGLMFKDPAPPLPSGKKEGYARHVLRPIVIFMILACAGVVGLYFADRKLFQLAALMLRIDLFAFGGGFASLPLMFHEVVNAMGWMDGKTFMDGIALGQVTPGPIIITATFVGYLVRGFPGALVATAAIFTPSFVVLVAVTPFFDRLKNTKYFSGATRGILASFVGLLCYMTIKFAVAVPWDVVKVLFGIAVLVALARKVNILHVVLVGSVLSIIIFR
jgi:chromate transporter